MPTTFIRPTPTTFDVTFVEPTPMAFDDETLKLLLRHNNKNLGIKVASRDLLLEPLKFPLDLATSMTIDDMGALELINTARHDLINGNNPEYKAIKGLTAFNEKYNPLKILALADGTPFDSFNYHLEYYIPVYTTAAEIANANGANYYLDGDNLVIEFVNITDGLFVEVELVTQGDVYDIL